MMEQRLYISSIILLTILVLSTDEKILRVGRNFEARFTLIDSNFRLMANCIQNFTNIDLRPCIKQCALNGRCQTINYEKEKRICELLSITKFDEDGLLTREENWVHYETDDDVVNLGPVCEKLQPCESHHVCEDTFQAEPKYVCKCRDGFKGTLCDKYIGPGYSSDKRAASCYLLFKRLKDIPNDFYWIKGKKDKVKCNRRVDGGYTVWSSFSDCSHVCGPGVKKRFRNCTNPAPQHGGRDCSIFGPSEEVWSCLLKNCPIHGGFSNWSAFTPCSHTCGKGGKQSRRRKCDNPAPQHGGNDCQTIGKYEEVQSCMQLTCQDWNYKIFLNETKELEAIFTTQLQFLSKQYILQFDMKIKNKLALDVFRLTTDTGELIMMMNLLKNLTAKITYFDSSDLTIIPKPVVYGLIGNKAITEGLWTTFQIHFVQYYKGTSQDEISLLINGSNHGLYLFRSINQLNMHKMGPITLAFNGIGNQISNVMFFQKDPCRYITCDPKEMRCYGAFDTYSCKCDQLRKYYPVPNVPRICKRNCIIEVLGNDTKTTGGFTINYFEFDKTALYKLTENSKLSFAGRNLRLPSNEDVIEVETSSNNFIGDARGRFVTIQEGWQNGDLIAALNFCPPEQDIKWTRQEKDHGCLRSNRRDFVAFTITETGLLYSIRLVHTSGYVSCNREFGKSNWGCNDDRIFIVITDANNKVILPKGNSGGPYKVNGFHSNSRILPFHTVSEPRTVNIGEVYHIWYTETLVGGSFKDNDGSVCFEIEALIISDS